MAPTNDMNGPAIAFLALSCFFLLLLMLVWYRYLIWWNRKGGERRFERKTSLEGVSPDPVGLPKDRRSYRHRRTPNPRSLPPTNIDQGMSGRSPLDYRVQPPADAMTKSRDQWGTEGQNEPTVEELERELYPGGGLRAEYRKEPPQEHRRECREDAHSSEPQESRQGSSRRNERRVSFAGREPEVQQQGGCYLSGQEKEYSNNEHEYGGEEQEWEQQQRRNAREYSDDTMRPEIGGEVERDYRRSGTSSINAERGSGPSERDEQRNDDRLGKIGRVYIRPERYRSRRRDREESTSRARREDSSKSTRDDEINSESRAKENFDERNRAKGHGKAEMAGHPREEAQDSKDELDLGRPDLKSLDGLSDAEDDRRYARGPERHRNNERGDIVGPPPSRGEMFK